MAKEKRMISTAITKHDEFLDMPLSAQALYFHLNMDADDEGFVSNVKSLMRQVRCSEDDLKILLAKRYILKFESGVVVIKHWLIHNTIRQDRVIETKFTEEKSLLAVKENGSYTEKVTALQIDDLGGVSQVSDTVSDKCPPRHTNLISTDLSLSNISFIKEVIDYLNNILGTKYRYDNTANNKLINGRISEGRTLEDFKKVIDVKYDEWKNTDMAIYLRPQTLFNKTNFEGYLNQLHISKTKTLQDRW